MASPPAIKTAHLSKRYGRVAALTDLDVTVEAGEIFGFLGPNGAGKSTTIRLLLGFLTATAGTASVLGYDIRRDSIAIRSRIGYLPSGMTFDETTTGLRALDDLAALQKKAPTLRDELCERLQLPQETLRRKVRDFSRGTRQKLGIVQALQHDPDLAILDEPTEGLDPLVQHSFYAILDDYRKRGHTVFFSSHVLSEVERVCDHVAIIKEGRLATTEDVHALLAKHRRHVHIRCNGELPTFTNVVGVTDVVVNDGSLSCRLQGDMRPFLQAVAQATNIVDMVIEPARLDDVFLEFYGPKGEDA